MTHKEITYNDQFDGYESITCDICGSEDYSRTIDDFDYCIDCYNDRTCVYCNEFSLELTKRICKKCLKDEEN